MTIGLIQTANKKAIGFFNSGVKFFHCFKKVFMTWKKGKKYDMSQALSISKNDGAKSLQNVDLTQEWAKTEHKIYLKNNFSEIDFHILIVHQHTKLYKTTVFLSKYIFNSFWITSQVQYEQTPFVLATSPVI